MESYHYIITYPWTGVTCGNFFSAYLLFILSLFFLWLAVVIEEIPSLAMNEQRSLLRLWAIAVTQTMIDYRVNLSTWPWGIQSYFWMKTLIGNSSPFFITFSLKTERYQHQMHSQNVILKLRTQKNPEHLLGWVKGRNFNFRFPEPTKGDFNSHPPSLETLYRRHVNG